MEKFYGKVNGVKYTDKKEFDDAVAKAMESDSYSIESYAFNGCDGADGNRIYAAGLPERDKNGRFVKKDSTKSLGEQRETEKPKPDFKDVYIDRGLVNEYFDENDYTGFVEMLNRMYIKNTSKVTNQSEQEQLNKYVEGYVHDSEKDVENLIAEEKKICDKIDELDKQIDELRGKFSTLHGKKRYLNVLHRYYKRLQNYNVFKNNLKDNSDLNALSTLSDFIKSIFIY